VVDSMSESFTKIVVHPACASAHGFQIVQVNFREFWVIKKLIHHGGNRGYLSNRMSSNNAVRKLNQLFKGTYWRRVLMTRSIFH